MLAWVRGSVTVAGSDALNEGSSIREFCRSAKAPRQVALVVGIGIGIGVGIGIDSDPDSDTDTGPDTKPR
jgi:hypothetical protein